MCSTVIQGKDGSVWVKRWPLGRSFLILEVDSLGHNLWGRFDFNSRKKRFRLLSQIRIKRYRWF